MASGIAIADKCFDAFKALNSRDYGSVILKIDKDATEISLETTYPPNEKDPVAEWEAVISSLPVDDCRYIVTDFKWKETATVTKSKVVLVLWSCEDAVVKSKMYV